MGGGGVSETGSRWANGGRSNRGRRRRGCGGGRDRGTGQFDGEVRRVRMSRCWGDDGGGSGEDGVAGGGIGGGNMR